DNPTGTAVEFGNINPTYPNSFMPFSPQRLFIARNTTLMEVNFFIPGTKIPATVAGFGVIFTDVDLEEHSRITLYAPDGSLMTTQTALPLNNGLSFVGVSFNAGERIARVVIQSGTHPLSAANTDGQNGVDVVAMDDFLYGEPRAMQYHPSDFDGDGATDRSIFRPSTGEWYIFHSGSGALTGGPFGTNGDIPLEGDFDGDQRSDIAVWRPSTGQWIILGSSNNQVMFINFGSNGDRPVPGDYDKDGKTDPAVWRASNSGWYFLRSSSNYTTFDVIGFGIPGDIPVPASPLP
ncbi:MAG TPA: VCBS repeat-containing protein, partial [Pyrinomonadaceae bacterium]|nr:VCBS repeat-containing protein [Pyrinomonadaceae bacterium]